MNAAQTTLKAQLAAKDDTIKHLTAQVKMLTETIATLTKAITEDGGSNKKRTNDGKKKNPTQRPAVKCEPCDEQRPPWLLKLANMGAYCWTCGYNPIGKGHTSKTCKNKAPGHKDEATVANRMGGSEANKPADM